MATTNILKNVKRMAKFNFISSNYVSSVSTHANTPTPINKLMEVLHDGITSKQGTYGAVILAGGTTAYIEFKVEEDCRFWATSGVYSDSGGASGAELNIYKYNNELQTYQLFKTVPTTATEDWYVVCDLLTRGTYKIQAKGNYVQFNEFYFESIVENKTFILHDSEYKKYNAYIPSVPPSASTNTSIPAMTSNITPYGEAFSKNHPESAYKLFDGNTSTNFPVDYRQTDGIIGYNFKKKVKIVKYGIICAKYYGLNTWDFEGSNDGVNWTKLNSQTGQSWNEGGEKIYEISSPDYYEMYRINFTKVTNNERTNFSELKMYEYIDGAPSIPAYWSTISNTIPNSTQFLDKGMDNLSPLLDRKVTNLEPLPMSNKSELLQTGEVGKVFSKTLDLKKYFDIRSIRTEVK